MQNTYQEKSSDPISKDFLFGKKLEGGIKLSIVSDFKPAGDQPKAIEKLILGIKNAKKWVKKVKNAGTIFLGYLSPVSAGDFGVGINHILPTGGNASFSSSLGVRDFMKEINMVELNRKGIEKISPIVKTFSKLERLPIHGEEISCREEKMKP